MTDNEIMKALRCCADRYCNGCSEQGKPNCRESVAALAWDLMYNQKAEIERLQKHNTVIAHKHFNDGIKYLAEKIYQEIGSEKNKHYKAISERVERFGADRYEDCFCAVCDGKILALDELRFFIEDFVKEEAGEE